MSYPAGDRPAFTYRELSERLPAVLFPSSSFLVFSI